MLHRVTIIAEVGVNHNGSLDRAREMVEVAARAGADIVKFQTFKAEKLVTRFAPKAPYQEASTADGGSQLDMLRQLELNEEETKNLVRHCQEQGVEFLSTPFDLESLHLLKGVGLKRLKISSGDLTNGPLLLEAARVGLPMIVSTGMSRMGEVEEALGVMAYGYLAQKMVEIPPSRAAFRHARTSLDGEWMLKEKVTLLHCVTAYPAPVEEMNLRNMDMLKERFRTQVGLSDHSRGISVSLAAVARGARVIEKHFTLDKSLPGPDHAASLDPDELSALVRGVRDVELALGAPGLGPTRNEVENMGPARKGLVAARAIARGTVLTPEMIDVKRPSGALSPMVFWEIVGRPANRDYAPDELFDAEMAPSDG